MLVKNFLIILFLFLSFLIAPAFADSARVLESATGVVENITYEDMESINQGEQTVKQEVTVRVLSGDFKGTERIIDNVITGNRAYDIMLSKGDKVILHLEPVSEIVTSSEDVNFYIADIKRDNGLIFFTALFCGLLILIGKRKGVYAIVSIAATVGLIFIILVPMILKGLSPIGSAIPVCILSTIITIYLVGGFNSKSTSAILGVTFSLVLTAILSIIAIIAAHLTGFAGEEPMFLYAERPDLNFTGILSASMLIAALGALMDTGVSIASTINEVYETDKNLTVRQLFNSGMNVGKDIIGTMSNTLILVYLGTSLPLVLLSSNIDLNKFFNLNQVATEILAALIGSIGILACVPITAIITAYLIKRQKKQDIDLGKIELEE